MLVWEGARDSESEFLQFSGFDDNYIIYSSQDFLVSTFEWSDKYKPTFCNKG